MNSYTLSDFTESMLRARQQYQLRMSDVKSVRAAWGVDVDGWSGGFLLELKDGTYNYLTGWCDFTGWGCQDGITLTTYESCPTLDELQFEDWDMYPTDLNDYLGAEKYEDDSV